MFRSAQPEDLPQLVSLFEKTFGDPESFAKMTFQEFAGLENVYLIEREGQIAASLCAVPVTLKGVPGVYYYAVETAEAWRGQGLATQLMQEAWETLSAKGARFAVLIPATASLFDFYEKRGFQRAFAKRSIQRSIRNNLWAVAEFDTITAKGLEQMRRKYAPNSVLFSSAGYVCVLTNLYSSGLTTVSTEQGYGLYFKRKEHLEFVELFAETDRDAEFLLEAARQKDGLETAVIHLGQCQNLFLGEGTVQDYGMIRLAQPGLDVSECYMRLMMDDE